HLRLSQLDHGDAGRIDGGRRPAPARDPGGGVLIHSCGRKLGRVVRSRLPFRANSEARRASASKRRRSVDLLSTAASLEGPPPEFLARPPMVDAQRLEPCAMLLSAMYQ